MKTIILSILFLVAISCTEEKIVPVSAPVPAEVKATNKYCDPDYFKAIENHKVYLLTALRIVEATSGNTQPILDELHQVNYALIKCRYQSGN